MFLSKAVMSDWDSGLRTGRNTLTFNKYKVTIPFAEDNAPVSDLSDIDITNLRQEWSRIPPWYNISGHGPWRRSVNGGHIAGCGRVTSAEPTIAIRAYHKRAMIIGAKRDPSYEPQYKVEQDIALLHTRLREIFRSKPEHMDLTTLLTKAHAVTSSQDSSEQRGATMLCKATCSSPHGDIDCSYIVEEPLEHHRFLHHKHGLDLTVAAQDHAESDLPS